MPGFTTIALVGGLWLALVVFACALCVAAGRADRADRARRSGAGVPPEPPSGLPDQPPPAPAGARFTRLVADTGALRDQLRAGAELLDAEQLTLTVALSGRDVVLATSRAVIELHADAAPEACAALVRDGRTLGRLHAVRQAGAAPFDETDCRLLDALAGRLAQAVEPAHASTPANPDSPVALA